MSRAKDLATMIFRCSAGYVRKPWHVIYSEPKMTGPLTGGV
jgi:hypothetical protein